MNKCPHKCNKPVNRETVKRTTENSVNYIAMFKTEFSVKR